MTTFSGDITITNYILARGLTPFLFIPNNDGYAIHGATATYNDIQPYNHALLLDFLSRPSKNVNGDASLKKSYHRVSTRAELDTLLKDTEFQAGKCIQLIEIVMPRDDAPRGLLTQAKLTSKINNAV